jgi:peroxiredoxin
MTTLAPVKLMTPTEYNATRIAAMPSRVKPGDSVPDVKLSRYEEGDKPGSVKAVEFSTSSLFGKGRWVLFLMPGAFTPVCSVDHLPSIVKVQAAFAEHSCNIAIVTTNDRDVLRGWFQKHNVIGLTPVPDFQAEFVCEGLGLAVDKTEPRNLGIVALRGFVMIEDGVVRHVAVDEDATKCTISSGAEALSLVLDVFSRKRPRIEPTV